MKREYWQENLYTKTKVQYYEKEKKQRCFAQGLTVYRVDPHCHYHGRAVSLEELHYSPARMKAPITFLLIPKRLS